MAARIVQEQQQETAADKNAWMGGDQAQSAAWRNVAAARAAAAASEESWEVKAFAEDAASCSDQWPPRSYSCSFCAREFRTAQALGGHMNVHRRERAYANQLGLLRPTNSLPASPIGGDMASTGATPTLGLCWLYPVAAPTGNSNLVTYQHQVPSTTVTTTAPVSSNCSLQRTKSLGAFQPYHSNSSMTGTAEQEVDLELRLGPAL